MKEDIILIGGGGHCKSCIDVIELEDKYTIAGILDVKEKLGESVLGYNIIGTDADIEDLSKTCNNFFITLGQMGSPDKRFSIFNILKKLDVSIPAIISPLSYVAKSAVIGEGSIVMHHALINSDAVIGSNCIINTKSLIEHDAVVESHCHIATGAVVNGNALVRGLSFVGSNAVVKENCETGEKEFIKANSLFKGHEKK